ncbi:ImmA/IrrE family metallo-endopeptidase [Endozoicomonas sp. SESOKO2]|uniref:ImmA/IrrE family metallo-endopeptidase n=1 Tax=Endozoicomonas sp. SESOKO2 TaxID=2828743 RepID=UPI0021487A9D|nr:ImmA/IrrE family metallo-endopeptidase [Endozoicomonas sp. SESOKO2]
MTTITTPIKRLERRLADSGFPKAFIKTVMPDWWDKSLGESAQSILMLKMHLSKHLGLDLASLVDDAKSVRLAPAGHTHYRLTQSKSKKDVVVAQSLAESLARLVASATPKPYVPIPKNPEEVRREILNTNKWVSLEALIDYLWEHGVPVIHLKQLPAGAKKFDGMVVDVDGRPVIVLTRVNKAPAWQLFILAHETGHIGNGHVDKGAVFFDEKVEGSDKDKKEEEATEYGMHLLTRVKDAQAALKEPPGQYSAPEYITEVLYQKIDLDLLPEDSKDILERLM